MKSTKNIGIWMDHSTANIYDETTGGAATSTIETTFSHEVKQEVLHKSEHQMHNKEQQQQAAYYKQLADVIVNYENVLLFGPTNAKVELFNILRADLAFSNIKIEVKDADKMTDNQQRAFVKDYFAR
jgi:stalled ribosome rescue protein Dom34